MLNRNKDLQTFIKLPKPLAHICSDDYWEKENKVGPRKGELVMVTHIGILNDRTFFKLEEFSDKVFHWHSFDRFDDMHFYSDLATVVGVNPSL